MKPYNPGPIVGAKPTLIERAARAFSLRRGAILAIVAAATVPLYAVIRTGDLTAYTSPEALILASIFAPIAFVIGLFTDRLPF